MAKAKQTETKPEDERPTRAQVAELIERSTNRADYLFDRAIKENVALKWGEPTALAQAIRDASRAGMGLKANDPILPKHLGGFQHLINHAYLSEGGVSVPPVPKEALDEPQESAQTELLPPEDPAPAQEPEVHAEPSAAREMAVAVARPKDVSSVAIDRGLAPANMDELYRTAVAVHRSGLAPRSLRTAEAVFVSMATGLELGLKPMSSMRAVYVINGMPCLKGEAGIAIVRNSGKVRYWRPSVEGEGDERMGVIRSMRTDNPDPLMTRFSVAQAKQAGLWGKTDPWKGFPDRMLVWRAVGHHLSDFYSDVILGIPLYEVARDLPASIEPSERGEPPADVDPLLIAT